MRQARGETLADEIIPDLHVEIGGRIPPEVVPDADTRLALCAPIAKARHEDELDQVDAEIEDRFGEAPNELNDLLALARIRLRCRGLGITRVDASPQAIALTLRQDDSPETPHAGRCGLRRSGERLIADVPTEPGYRIEALVALLDDLAG